MKVEHSNIKSEYCQNSGILV